MLIHYLRSLKKEIQNPRNVWKMQKKITRPKSNVIQKFKESRYNVKKKKKGK